VVYGHGWNPVRGSWSLVRAWTLSSKDSRSNQIRSFDHIWLVCRRFTPVSRHLAMHLARHPPERPLLCSFRNGRGPVSAGGQRLGQHGILASRRKTKG
jgi:hypothetical protein